MQVFEDNEMVQIKYRYVGKYFILFKIKSKPVRSNNVSLK